MGKPGRPPAQPAPGIESRALRDNPLFPSHYLIYVTFEDGTISTVGKYTALLDDQVVQNIILKLLNPDKPARNKEGSPAKHAYYVHVIPRRRYHRIREVK